LGLAGAEFPDLGEQADKFGKGGGKRGHERMFAISNNLAILQLTSRNYCFSPTVRCTLKRETPRSWKIEGFFLVKKSAVSYG
jgi:hypothetical protein